MSIAGSVVAVVDDDSIGTEASVDVVGVASSPDAPPAHDARKIEKRRRSLRVAVAASFGWLLRRVDQFLEAEADLLADEYDRRRSVVEFGPDAETPCASKPNGVATPAPAWRPPAEGADR